MARSSIDDRAFYLPKMPYSYLRQYQDAKKPADWALLERSLNYWTAARDGSRRVRGFANDAVDPTNPLYSTNPVVGNTVVNWLEGAWFQDSDGYSQLARWDYANGTFVPGPTLLGTDGDGFKLRPISIARAGQSSLYVVAHDGSISYWDGTASSFSPASASITWLTRTPTTDLMNSPDLLHYGYGNEQDLYAVLDTLQWDGTFTDYASSAIAITHPNDPPGFGGFWAGKAVWIEKVGGQWYGLWHGPVWGDVADPTPNPSTQFACLALLKCIGGNPASHASWQDTGAFLYPFAPYDLNTKASDGGTVSEPETQFLLWKQTHGDSVYFWGDPQSPGGSGLVLKPAIYYLAPADDFGVSLSYPAANCYGGPLCEAGGDLYAVMVLAGSDTLRLYHLDSAPNSWSVESDTPWTYSPHRLGSMYGIGDYIHIALGRDVPGSGTGSGTAWEVMTYRLSTGEWRRMAATYPAPYGTASDTGLFAKMFEAKGGGSGVSPTGGGYCDSEFSIYSAPTITETFFSDHLTADSSPLLGEQPAHFWWTMITGYGLNPAYILAIIHKESVCGSSPGEVLLSSHNPGNIRVESWGRQSGSISTICCGVFGTYASYEDGMLDECELWGLSIYSGLTISQAINIYAPPSENDTDAYITQLCDRLRDWKAASGL
jgi:hypothetical protein